jgi:hypothetical protein
MKMVWLAVIPWQRWQPLEPLVLRFHLPSCNSVIILLAVIESSLVLVDERAPRIFPFARIVVMRFLIVVLLCNSIAPLRRCCGLQFEGELRVVGEMFLAIRLGLCTFDRRRSLFDSLELIDGLRLLVGSLGMAVGLRYIFIRLSGELFVDVLSESIFSFSGSGTHKLVSFLNGRH